MLAQRLSRQACLPLAPCLPLPRSPLSLAPHPATASAIPSPSPSLSLHPHPTPTLQLLIEQSFVWDSRMEVKLLVTLLGRAQQVAKAQGGASGGGAWAHLQALLSRASRVRVGPGGRGGGGGRCCGDGGLLTAWCAS